LKKLVEILVRALVDEPDKVEVVEEQDDDIITYRVSVAPADLGKVIGKDGKIANALRTVTKAAAMKEGRKVYVDIIS
jgi:predicted RNA-binding protein YlqC (UPF0109 family)